MTTLPVIHLNGSGKKNLQEEYESARKELIKARDSFSKTTCHPRDFYPAGDGAYLAARKERDEVFAAFNLIENYLDSWSAHLYDSDKF